MITKPEKIIKRIIKAIGQRQSVLLIGDWDETLIKGIQNNQNTITIEPNTKNITDNSFTRIVVDYGRDVACNISTIYMELRRLLLPTGMIIISANCEDGLFRKVFSLFKKPYIKEGDIKKIKPKILQDEIHDNGFLIDGYYGYPGNHLLMMAVIQNKEVSTLFTGKRQETIHI